MNYFGNEGWSEGNWPGTPEFEDAKLVIQSSTDEQALARSLRPGAGHHVAGAARRLDPQHRAGIPLPEPNLTGVWVEPSGTTHVEGARFTK